MFRLYSSGYRTTLGGTRKNAMSKLQEQLLRIGSKQIEFLTRLLVIVHNDLVRLARLALLTLRVIGNRTANIFRDLARANPFNRASKPAASGPPPQSGKTPKPDAPLAQVTATNRVTSLPDNQCIYAIGDIHGRCDLLLKLLDKIDEDVAQLPEGTEITIVFLGDYIDRGMQSRQVIDVLLGERLKAYQTVFLMGNHEEALLQFREDASFGVKWSQYGGAETLFSYGLQPPQGRAQFDPDAWHMVWDQFRTLMPPAHLDFFQSMEHYFTMGDYCFVHAGLRPNVPLEEQSVDDMLWIRDDFLEDETMFDHLIVHGHTPEHAPFLDNRRMGLDTAAYSSGMLTAAKFIDTEIDVIMT